MPKWMSGRLRPSIGSPIHGYISALNSVTHQLKMENNGISLISLILDDKVTSMLVTGKGRRQWCWQLSAVASSHLLGQAYNLSLSSIRLIHEKTFERDPVETQFNPTLIHAKYDLFNWRNNSRTIFILTSGCSFIAPIASEIVWVAYGDRADSLSWSKQLMEAAAKSSRVRSWGQQQPCFGPRILLLISFRTGKWKAWLFLFLFFPVLRNKIKVLWRANIVYVIHC